MKIISLALLLLSTSAFAQRFETSIQPKKYLDLKCVSHDVGSPKSIQKFTLGSVNLIHSGDAYLEDLGARMRGDSAIVTNEITTLYLNNGCDNSFILELNTTFLNYVLYDRGSEVSGRLTYEYPAENGDEQTRNEDGYNMGSTLVTCYK